MKNDRPDQIDLEPHEWRSDIHHPTEEDERAENAFWNGVGGLIIFGVWALYTWLTG